MPCTEMLFSGKYSDCSLNNPDQHYAFSVANSIHHIQNPVEEVVIILI